MLNFPSYAEKCLNKIKENGFEAYFVGGCVRDALIGREYDDVDITTNATPDQIVSIFEHTVPTGIAHGTVTVIIDGRNIEVTTYRTEKGYSDSRHPDSVNFVSDLKEDLSRRDFTINALAFDPEKEIVDLFDGIEDLNNGVIRAVGDPMVRFTEDALRILRAFRFSSVLGMRIEKETKEAAFKLAHTVKKVSGERILSELTKLVSGNISKDIADFINAGALKAFGILSLNYDPKVLAALSRSNFDIIEKTAIFLSLTEHDSKQIKSALKPSANLTSLLDYYDRVGLSEINISSRQDLKLALKSHSKRLILAYLNRLSLFDSSRSKKALENISDIEQSGEPYTLEGLCINGNDLIALGITGMDIGHKLNQALELVIKDPSLNTKEKLMKILFS